MLSKSKQTQLRKYALKKHRDAESVFVAEGPKVVEELLPHFKCRMLCATTDYLQSAIWRRLSSAAQGTEVIEVSERELTSVSNQKSPQQVVAVFEKPDFSANQTALLKDAATSATSQLLLALDGVQDPGNLGTIIRLADWFGIRTIICSPDTADAFAPKVVQATMGALARVSVVYTSLGAWLESLPDGVPVYGTHLDGQNLYAQQLTPHGVIIMGNEGKGITPEVGSLVTHRLRIPSYPPGEPTSESLNVAIATAVVCAEFRRTTHLES